MGTLKLYSIFLIPISIVLMCACASTFPPREGWMDNFEIEDALKTQEKENITITLNPINDLDIDKHPNLFQFNVQNWDPSWSKLTKTVNFWYPPNKDGNNYANTFVGMPAFLVSIKNSTGHILRMSDARIYLIIEEKDPIPAIENFGNTQVLPMQLVLYSDKPEMASINKSAVDEDESLLDYITRREVQIIRWLKDQRKSDNTYKKYPQYPLNLCFNTAFTHQNDYKLINEVGREILPDFTLDGIICFPYYLEKGQKAKIIFYDVTTETNEAGTPTKKTQFDFSFQYEPAFMRYDELSKSWKDQAPPAK
jgi:hypothetical protein